MLLVIDAGNTQTVFGLWNGSSWQAIWRMQTNPPATEDEIGAFYLSVSGGNEEPKRCLCANVVPALSDSLSRFAKKWLGCEIEVLSSETVPALEIRYEPKSAVGADRLANAIAAKSNHKVPAIVVDFGTATTFDAVGPNGEYMGGSIMTGPVVSMEALFMRAAKLPKVELAPPKNAIGHDTNSSLQSGLMLGYAGAIDSLARRIKIELGGSPVVIATGGLAPLFAPLCEQIDIVDENLTIDGIRLAFGA